MTEIHTHSYLNHYGGVLEVTSHEDIESGKVKIYALEGYTAASVNEGVIGGNRQTQLSGYQHSQLVEYSATGNMTSGLGLDTSKGRVTFAVPTAPYHRAFPEGDHRRSGVRVHADPGHRGHPPLPRAPNRLI